MQRFGVVGGCSSDVPPACSENEIFFYRNRGGGVSIILFARSVVPLAAPPCTYLIITSTPHHRKDFPRSRLSPHLSIFLSLQAAQHTVATMARTTFVALACGMLGVASALEVVTPAEGDMVVASR